MPRRAPFLTLLVTLTLAACSDASVPTTTVSTPTTDPSTIVQTRAALQTRAAQPFPTPTARPRETRVPIPRPRTLPYAVPASCNVSPMAGAEVRRTYPAWWLDGMGLWAGNALGVYYIGSNKVQWQPDQMGPYDQGAAITASGTRLDGPAAPMRLDNPVNIGTGYSSGVIFSAPGCWQLHGAVGTQTLDATVYVYPDGCASEDIRRGPATFPCIPPPTLAVASCPVTQPPASPRVPPPAVSAGQQIGTGAFWYGNDALWVTLLAQGSLLQSDKMVWWHTIPGWLAVEGRRLDDSAPPLAVNIPAGYDDMNLQATGLYFPTPGCWEVTGRVAGRELRFVVNVVPNPPPPSPAATAGSSSPVAASCPVTQAPNPPLMPPTNVSGTQTGEHGFWWGNDSQWVILRDNGTLWSAKFMWWRTASGQLTIEG